MVSKYFEMKTSTEEFKQETEELIKSLEGKKVLIYGAEASFNLLNQNYNIKERLNVVCIADKKFNKTNTDTFCGYKAIKTDQIPSMDFDVVLVTNEHTKPITKLLEYDFNICKDRIIILFKETIKDEISNYNFLMKNKFDKTLPKLLKKVKNKRVIFYGAGVFLELIKKYFDISELNVIGISDKRFSSKDAETEFLGYKTISPEKIRDINPDYVIVATKYYINIIEDLHYNLLRKSKIKIKPLVDKSFLTLFREINV